VSSKRFHIPKHGGAESAFLGVEFQDTYILIISVLVAIVAGKLWGTWAYLVIPFGGYHLNKLYIDWRDDLLPGFVQAWLFRFGIRGYSGAFPSQRTRYVGDAAIINRGSRRLVQAQAARSASQDLT
jgi:hypothetical protein